MEALSVAIQSTNEARYSMLAMYVLQVYELLRNLDAEMTLIHRARWTSLKSAYLLCRYYLLLFWPFLMWAYIGDHKIDLCRRVGRPVHAMLAPCQFFSQAVMVMRAYAFSGRDKRILVLLLACYSGLVAVNIWIFCIHTYIPPAELFFFLQRTGCFPNYGEGITGKRIGYAMLAAMLMDTISLLVVILCCLKRRTYEISLGRYFLQQGLFSFALVCIVNVASAINYFKPPSFESGVGLPLIMVVPNLVACHVILDLRKKVTPTDSEISRRHSLIIRNALDTRWTASWTISPISIR
ncbi:hypothetical protein BDQ17DRAFT_1428769 [Cyathus striatus]|nr:hypothetical protein BDQ17DRAFT_1428769 [Cyathus striatus]